MNAVQIAEILALFACGLFTGAAVYISLVEHPARIACGSEIAIAQFRPSYKRAAVIQAFLAIIGFAASVTAWLLEGHIVWLLGGALLVSVVPFTLLVIFPTNRQLLDPGLDARSAHAGSLLQRWGRLHVVRSILSSAAFLLFLYAVL